jgi:DNA/RNA-binding domain of Phe-tRNA-synthetase-like protein
MELVLSERWRATYPGASVGILAIAGAENPASHPGLEAAKRELEARLRKEFEGLDRPALRQHPRIQPYAAYYSRFDKTYHVQLQLESVVLKAKPLPTTAALVDAMLMAELKNLLLTAGHDLEVVKEPLAVDVADGRESYIRLGGNHQSLKPGDMMIRDAEGVISCIVYGPDERSRLTSRTTMALYTVYAPQGVPGPAVRKHLEDVQSYIRLFSPAAKTSHLEVHTAA